MNVAQYNPFGEFREHQEDVINQIIEMKESNICNIVLKAPVASGKSLIAYVVARYLQHEEDENSLIFTSTKFLQDQYLRDFSQLKTVKGRNNFTCLHNKRTCDKGSCKEICGFTCPNSVDGNLELKQDRYNSCPYWVQKVDAINAPISIVNYAFGLVDRNFVQHFQPRDFAIFDEAHNIEAELMNFLEIEVSPRQLYNDIKYNVNFSLRDIQQWSEIFLDIAKKYQNAAKEELNQGNKEKGDAFISKYEKYKITSYLMGDNPENWIIDADNQNLIFKPILVNEYAQKSLLSFGKTRLFMSGSILKNHSFCETLGLDIEDTQIIEVPSIIDPSRRPVYKEYAGSMSLRQRNTNINKIVDKILEISARYPNDKGVVHTYTYVVSKMIEDKLNGNDRFIFHNSKNRQSQTQKFINSSEPKIFVSPYSFEGVDFKDDLARFQIIAKNPFPNMFQNNQYQERDRVSNFHWIFELRAKVLSQMYGRIVRSPNDWGDTYLIDSDIDSLLGKSSLVTGYMLEGFVDSWINKEIVVLDETKLSPDKRKSYEAERFNERMVLEEIKRMDNPTVVKLTELYKHLPNDSYREIRPICERLLKNEAIALR